MDIFVCCILIIIFGSTNGQLNEEEKEEFDRCKAERKTVFAMEGSTVTYTINLEYITSEVKFGWLDDSFVYDWYNGYIEQYDLHRDIRPSRPVWYNRSNIDILLRYPDNRTVASIELHDLMLMDDRIYYTNSRKRPLHFECFHLYVMEKLKAKPNGTLEENEPVYVYAPDIPHVNATTLWLLDGLTSDQTALFIQRDDYIWIPQVKKHLDGKNVTFRTILDETVFDNNFTLSVRKKLKAKPNGTLEENEQVYVYASDIPHVNTTTLWLLDGLTSDQTELFIQRDDYIWIPQVKKHLDGKNVTFRTILNKTVFDNNFTLSVRTMAIQIFPEEQIYIVTVGDKLPVITCSSNCAPACVVSWGKHSSNRLLSLGTATKETNGRYTCTATRLDSKRKVEISVTVHVQDDNNILMQGILMKVIVGSASGQVLTLLVFGLCVLVVCKRINKLSSKTSSDTATNNQDGANITNDTVGYQLTNFRASSALENYDSLKPNEIYDTAT